MFLARGELTKAEQAFQDLLHAFVEAPIFPLQGLHAVVGIASVYAIRGEGELSLMLATKIVDHPAARVETKDKARVLVGKLRAELSSERFNECEVRGREMDLFETVRAILDVS